MPLKAAFNQTVKPSTYPKGLSADGADRPPVFRKGERETALLLSADRSANGNLRQIGIY